MNELPNCHNYKNCGNKAMCYSNNMFLCGNCVIKIQNKIENLKKQLLIGDANELFK